MALYTLTNDFHDSHVVIRAVPGAEMSVRQIVRARAALCGMRDCQCSGPLGTRGPQNVLIEVSKHGYRLSAPETFGAGV